MVVDVYLCNCTSWGSRFINEVGNELRRLLLLKIFGLQFCRGLIFFFFRNAVTSWR